MHNQASLTARQFPCYLHSTGGMLGEGTACDDDDDEIDFCSSCASIASAASEIQTNDTKLQINGNNLCTNPKGELIWLEQVSYVIAN